MSRLMGSFIHSIETNMVITQPVDPITLNSLRPSDAYMRQ